MALALPATLVTISMQASALFLSKIPTARSTTKLDRFALNVLLSFTLTVLENAGKLVLFARQLTLPPELVLPVTLAMSSQELLARLEVHLTAM